MPHPFALAAVLVLATASAGHVETRADAAVHPAGDYRVADLPAGHWATNATRIAIANNVLRFDLQGAFHGDRLLTPAELEAALEALAETAEHIAAKGRISLLHGATTRVSLGHQTVTRLELAEALASFLDAAADEELLAQSAPTYASQGFKDLADPSPAVAQVVDAYKVMAGYPDNRFRPAEPVTRYQFAAIALEILNAMRMAPLAQQPVFLVMAVEATPPPPVIVTVPAACPPVAPVPTPTPARLSFRERAAWHLAWQAANADNLTAGPAFGAVPVAATVTGYPGAFFLQDVTHARLDAGSLRTLDTELRLGLSTFKWQQFQALPYLGAQAGLGGSAGGYGGPTYGGILSVLPTEQLELHARVGQGAMLAGAWGTFLNSYGAGADLYLGPKLCLSLGLDAWQNPEATGLVTTLGGSLGLGASF
jgi:hypothetical protein